MTITEVLPILKALNHKDKIRAIQFLANEVAKQEEVFSEERRNYEFWSQSQESSTKGHEESTKSEKSQTGVFQSLKFFLGFVFGFPSCFLRETSWIKMLWN